MGLFFIQEVHYINYIPGLNSWCWFKMEHFCTVSLGYSVNLLSVSHWFWYDDVLILFPYKFLFSPVTYFFSSFILYSSCTYSQTHILPYSLLSFFPPLPLLILPSSFSFLPFPCPSFYSFLSSPVNTCPLRAHDALGPDLHSRKSKGKTEPHLVLLPLLLLVPLFSSFISSFHKIS